MQPRDPITGRFVRDSRAVKAVEEQAAFADPRPTFDDLCEKPDALFVGIVVCAVAAALAVGVLLKGYFGL